MPTEPSVHSQSTSRADARESDVACPVKGFATRAIRIGQDPDSATGSTIVPIYQTATFTQQSVGVHKGFDYSRSGNPTRTALEKQLADLEGARYGISFGSGMAAAHAVTSLLSQGDHIVATREIYGGVHRLLTMVLPRHGITTTFVDMTDPAAVRAAVRPNTKLFWVETPTNPLLTIIDIPAIVALRKPGQLVAVDNTFLSPFLQRPLELGADIVWHSTTKYINGHSDVVGGVVVTSDDEVAAQIAFTQNAIGAVPGPQDAYLTLRGAKTLALRMREHVKNAQAVAEWLESRDDVSDVYYPGLRSHPQYELAKRQMAGPGGIVTFRVRGGDDRALAVASSTKLFNLAASLGGVESLICSPTSMTHGSIPVEEKIALGVTGDLLRISVGIEDLADLIADLDHALTSSAIFAIA
ncbi:MAG: PLP-dependent aspartate aminotransferase family protein [Candidatus Velthaea sp.]